jgi:hypothetical protein
VCLEAKRTPAGEKEKKGTAARVDLQLSRKHLNNTAISLNCAARGSVSTPVPSERHHRGILQRVEPPSALQLPFRAPIELRPIAQNHLGNPRPTAAAEPVCPLPLATLSLAFPGFDSLEPRCLYCPGAVQARIPANTRRLILVYCASSFLPLLAANPYKPAAWHVQCTPWHSKSPCSAILLSSPPPASTHIASKPEGTNSLLSSKFLASVTWCIWLTRISLAAFLRHGSSSCLVCPPGWYDIFSVAHFAPAQPGLIY